MLEDQIYRKSLSQKTILCGMGGSDCLAVMLGGLLKANKRAYGTIDYGTYIMSFLPNPDHFNELLGRPKRNQEN